MRRAIVLALCAGCSETIDLEWVTPVEQEVAPIGDAVELAVGLVDESIDPAGRAVEFAIDGVVVGTCDPLAEDEDCFRDDVWRWTVVFDRTGTHVLTARAGDSELVREIEVVHALKDEHFVDDPEALLEGDATTEPDDLPDVLAASSRGLLDPDRPF